MSESKAITQFREDVIGKLSGIEVTQKNMLEHLVKLNGSVAKHESMLNQVQSHGCEYHKERKGDSDNRTRIIWGVIGGVVVLILGHLPAIIGPWLR